MQDKTEGYWSAEVPKEPGLYWFYGDIFWGNADRSPEDFEPSWELVQAVRISNGDIIRVSHSSYIRPDQGYGVYWSVPVGHPELPREPLALPGKNG